MTGLSITFNVSNFPINETEFINIAGDDFSKVVFENDNNSQITIECTSIDSSGSSKSITYKYNATQKPDIADIDTKTHSIIILREGDNEDYVSSNLKYITYDANTQTLGVSFDRNSSIVYTYTPVDIGLFYRMMNAESIGGFFNKSIKNNPNIDFLRRDFDGYMEELEKYQNAEF